MPDVLKLPRVRCAVCDKPVDRVEWDYDFEVCRQRLRVWCHGAADVMILTNEDLQNFTADELQQLQSQEGLAFVTPRLQDQNSAGQSAASGASADPAAQPKG